MLRDVRGLEMTASSQEAVDAFDATIDEFLASGRDAAALNHTRANRRGPARRASGRGGGPDG